MISLSRRSLLKAAARLGVGAGLAMLGFGGERSRAQEESEGPFFRESEATLTLGNQYYEVDFDKRNGAITRIFDKRGGGAVSEGNATGSLWTFWSISNSESWFGGVNVRDFRWDWDDTSSTLRMTYDIKQRETEAQVRVDIAATTDSWFDLTANLDHHRGEKIAWFSFPNSLRFPGQDIVRTLLPYIGGLMLKKEFFSERRTFHNKYPGWGMMADLIWTEANHGTISIYTLHGDSPWWQTEVGIAHETQNSLSTPYWIHLFPLALDPGASRALPTVRVNVGLSAVDSLTAYRLHNKIDTYASADQKAGDFFESLTRAPCSAQLSNMVHPQHPMRQPCCTQQTFKSKSGNTTTLTGGHQQEDTAGRKGIWTLSGRLNATGFSSCHIRILPLGMNNRLPQTLFARMVSHSMVSLYMIEMASHITKRTDTAQVRKIYTLSKLPGCRRRHLGMMRDVRRLWM